MVKLLQHKDIFLLQVKLWNANTSTPHAFPGVSVGVLYAHIVS